MKQKNHDFLIDVFNELYKENSNYKLMLIGQGPLQEEIKQKVENLGLKQAVMFLGQKTDVNRYYQAMDLFLFPSLYEGLGMVMIEAQCSGLPCVASTEVPGIAKVNDNVEFIGLVQPINVWTEKVKEMIKLERIINLDRVKESGYDIVTEAKKLEREYLEYEGIE
jgi:glycosyltransferase involved in cell wall biosynthesis